MHIEFKKRSILTILIYVLALIPSILRGICVNFGLPLSIVKYTDYASLIIILFLFLVKNRTKTKYENIPILVGLGIIIGLSLMSLVVTGIPLAQYMRGIFNYFHIYIFLLIVAYTMTVDDYDTVGNLIIGIVVIDTLFVVYQYFSLGLSQDLLGGVFGNSAGANGIQNTFSCIGLIILLSRYLHNKTTFKKLAIYLLITAFIAGLAELTMYFFEIVILIVAGLVLNKQSKVSIKTVLKYTAIIATIIITVFIGFKVLITLFPTKARFVDIANVLDYIGASNSGTGVYEISRTRAVSQMVDLFLKSTYNKLFGFGIGYTIEGSAFFYSYSDMQYQWFSTAITMLESGYVGLLIKFLIFSYIFLLAGKKKKSTNDTDMKRWYLVSQLTVIFGIVIFFYNNTLENQYDSYIIGFYLASYGCMFNKKSKTNTSL